MKMSNRLLSLYRNAVILAAIVSIMSRCCGGANRSLRSRHISSISSGSSLNWVRDQSLTTCHLQVRIVVPNPLEPRFRATIPPG